MSELATQEILGWLRETDPARLEELYARADRVRRESVGDAVHLRGLVEMSNYCVRRCAYCGIAAHRRDLVRYRMTADEVVACAHQAVTLGYGTVVMQSGEDLGVTADWVADLVRRIRRETPLAVTLSLGERTDAEYAAWKEAGADRYLLRFETSNPELFARIHPSRPDVSRSRLDILRFLRGLGFETGSGIMLGIPGQTYADVARDLEVFGELDLDMIGVGPFIPHPGTPLGAEFAAGGGAGDQQVPNTEAMTYKVVALTRLLCPQANIPSTTALATLNQVQGRELGLSRGANIVMPNLTPVRYRQLYEIYPGKACIGETAEQCQRCLQRRIESIGRHIGSGRGDSPRFHSRRQAAGAT